MFQSELLKLCLQALALRGIARLHDRVNLAVQLLHLFQRVLRCTSLTAAFNDFLIPVHLTILLSYLNTSNSAPTPSLAGTANAERPCISGRWWGPPLPGCHPTTYQGPNT